MKDSTRRFSNRVQNYVRYRPGYPTEILKLLKDECEFSTSSVVADMGSGTGILSRMFLDNGNRVFGVEPNPEMREAGERLLAGYDGFISVPATAEETTLDAGSVDFVAAGQAFHWFEPEAARREFERILKPGGWVVLVWNARPKTGTPFMEAYERLVQRHGSDHAEVSHGRRGSAEEVRAFFEPDECETRTFANRQTLDFDGLKGRLLSSSYVPNEGEPGCAEMLDELERVFCEHERGGVISVEYDTRVYYGCLDNSALA